MASVGDGFTGDIAIDDLSFMDCTLYPGKREHFQICLFGKINKEINTSYSGVNSSTLIFLQFLKYTVEKYSKSLLINSLITETKGSCLNLFLITCHIQNTRKSYLKLWSLWDLSDCKNNYSNVVNTELFIDSLWFLNFIIISFIFSDTGNLNLGYTVNYS